MRAALQTFTEGADSAQALWKAGQDAYARALHALRIVQTSLDPVAQASSTAMADVELALHRALIEAAAVRLVTAWEVYLSDLFTEYLERRPASFKRVWHLKGDTTLTDETVEIVVQQRRFPFQDPARARELLREYLGKDLFGSGAHQIDLRAVEQLILIRNAIVHRAGRSTKQLRERLKTRKDAHEYLVSRRRPRALPPTQFERLLIDVSAAAHALYTRAYQRPRP